MTRDSAGLITSVEDSVTEMLGWRADELVGLPSTSLVHPDDQGSAITAWMAMITSPGTTQEWRGRYRTADGSWRWVETVNRMDLDVPFVSSTFTTVTIEQASVEDELRAREQLLSRLKDALPLGVFQMDVHGNITFSNDRLQTIVGQESSDTIEAQMAAVDPKDRPVLQAALRAVLSDQPVDEIEIRLSPAPLETPARGRARVCSLSLRALTDSTGVVTGAVGVLSDVTDRVRLREELELKASVDKLTSCLNRAASLELLDRIASATGPTGGGLAVVFIDLDRFKSVNDQFGHAAGDRVLVVAAERLRGAVRGRDEVGRLGGDEFLVICPRVDSARQAAIIADRIAAAINVTVDVGSGEVHLRASIGVAWAAGAIDADTLIAQADSAMYESKRSGGESVSMFHVPET
ncbi:MAG: diguanylate cyclase [Acidimicrobiales bacterium]